MFLFVAKSTCVYLWLSAAVLSLGSAENVADDPDNETRGIISIQRIYFGDGLSCLVPPQPTNGQWRLHRLFCDHGLDCDIPQGIELRNGSRLVYSCDPGYVVNGRNEVYCTALGKWSATPSCILYNATLPPSPRCLLWGQPVIGRDDYTYTPGVGHHKLHTRAAVWNEARMTCEDEGGYLAIINSIAEANAIAELFAKSEPIVGSPHPSFASIGFHDLYNEGQYITIHGQSLARAGYTGWADGQPDNAGGAENCGSIHTNGRLNDINCGTKFAFVCEIE